MRLFLCGDVMTGRGIDQILPFPCPPRLYESYVKSALRYVELAEKVNGTIPRAVGPNYIWGEALDVLQALRPQLRVINLETSLTLSEDWQPKGINYRMNPKNTESLQALQPDVCALANNHVMDWGVEGLIESLTTLKAAGISAIGAGKNDKESRQPFIVPKAQGRGSLLVFSLGHRSSGIPPSWMAGEDQPGLWLLRGLTGEPFEDLKQYLLQWKSPGDTVILSIHWGSNWGYKVPTVHQDFAHQLIEEAGVDLIHGHSSHHPLGFEVFKERLILYGCGDFMNDYEGIGGYEDYRSELVLMYFPELDEHGRLIELRMVPLRLKRFRLERATNDDGHWLFEKLKLYSQWDQGELSLDGNEILFRVSGD